MELRTRDKVAWLCTPQCKYLKPIFFSRAEEQERLRRQNEDDLAKLWPKADDFSLRNKYLSKLGAQVLVTK